MPIDRETGKDRWRRVPKDYFKHPDPLRRTRLRLSALAAVAAIAWWASGFDWSRGGTTANDAGRYRVSRGPVARVHAAWDHKCDACHVPFAPIDGRPLLPVLGNGTEKASGSDALCSSCHKVGAHHRATIAAEVPGCAECHRDHRGRDASLVRLSDGDCTSCHVNLAAHLIQGSARTRFADVRRFDRDHPPFRPKAATFVAGKPPEDRSRLKFNHDLHMRPGLVAGEGRTPYTLARIPNAADRPRYRVEGQADADPVRLDCTSCHTPEPADGGAKGGRYYQAVAYQASCSACHPLSFDPRKPDLFAPHGVQPGEVADFVRKTYAAQFLADDPKLLDAFIPTASIPGKTPEAAPARKKLDEAVAIAESLLFENATNCRECHHVVDAPDRGVVPSRIEPTNVPKVWFSHARFDHSAHRAVSCRDCHARAYAMEADGKTPVADASNVNTDLLVPDIANCRSCHGPAPSAGWFGQASLSTGGASQDCVECHRYHDGDRPAHGAGSLVKDETPGRTIAEFLSGISARPPR